MFLESLQTKLYNTKACRLKTRFNKSIGTKNIFYPNKIQFIIVQKFEKISYEFTGKSSFTVLPNHKLL